VLGDFFPVITLGILLLGLGVCLIGLPRTADQKSEAACKTYRDTNGKKQQLAA